MVGAEQNCGSPEMLPLSPSRPEMHAAPGRHQLLGGAILIAIGVRIVADHVMHGV
jgi:hypothetical protein